VDLPVSTHEMPLGDPVEKMAEIAIMIVAGAQSEPDTG
jgi:hypothetical protein